MSRKPCDESTVPANDWYGYQGKPFVNSGLEFLEFGAELAVTDVTALRFVCMDGVEAIKDTNHHQTNRREE
ncbi:MAG: hypothetical protein AAF456_00685 [Planctomycetota bacterium]